LEWKLADFGLLFASIWRHDFRRIWQPCVKGSSLFSRRLTRTLSFSARAALDTFGVESGDAWHVDARFVLADRRVHCCAMDRAAHATQSFVERQTLSVITSSIDNDHLRRA